jgi:hypothetical protein
MVCLAIDRYRPRVDCRWNVDHGWGGNGTPLDYDELERWTRVGYERGMRSRKGKR